MKQLSTLLATLVATWLQLSNAAAESAREPIPVISGGQSLCHPLQSAKAARRSEGIVCLRLHAQDPENIDVDIHITEDSLELEDVFLWIGRNAASIPPQDENGVAQTQLDAFPIIRTDIGKKSTSIQVSLQYDLGFNCTQNSCEYFAAVRASASSTDGRDKLELQLARFPDESDAEPMIPFSLSCKDLSLRPVETPQKRVRHINDMVTSTHRNVRRAQACPAYPAKINFNLTQTNMTQIYAASKLVATVDWSASGCILNIINEQRALYERFDGFWDINDQAAVAKTRDDGICYVAIMGTLSLNPLDQLQNLLFIERQLDGTDCSVRLGYLDAYNTSYKDELRKTIDNCVASCPNNVPCPLVITGHSQGGAAAIVASIDLAHYEPTTVTFGAPRGLWLSADRPCTTFDPTRHFRFVNTADPSIQGGGYDGITLGRACPESGHRGELLLLDNVNWPIANPQNDDDREPEENALHPRVLYFGQLENIMARGCFPVPVGPWPAGHYCTRSDECQGECKDLRCTGL